MDDKGYDFLNKIYQNLHLSDEVMHTATPSDTKNEKVAKYMERLDRVTRKAFDNTRATRNNDIAMLKKLYHDRYVITRDNIPESYFELQKQIALNEGHGHLEYTEEIRNQEIDNIIKEQEESIDNWIEYFASPDTDIYPTWYKYYAFQGMLKLGTYDKKQGNFNRRTSSTVKPFIELDREALAFVYDELIKSMLEEQIEDEDLEKLINNGNFGKLYGYALKKMDEAKKDISSDDGIWKKYRQGSNPEILYNDIHGKGTGWCTAGGLGTATTHLKDGDFYVYFTKSRDGEYSQPRIAIRKNGSKIAEIRGIGPNQNLECNMEKIVEKKLQEAEFPNRDEYKQKVRDMQMMTYVYMKWQNNGELSKDDLRFLYEIDKPIIGFGYQKDPRIEEIQKKRNVKKDLATILNCNEKQISINKKEALSEGIIYHYGDLNLDNLKSTKTLELPKHLGGSLDLKNLTIAEGLELPEYIGGDLNLASLTTTEGLKLPKHLGGSLDLKNLTIAEGLELPEYIGGDLNLASLTTTEGLKLPKHLGGSLDLSSLTTTEGLELPKHLSRSLFLSSLTTTKGLELPEYMEGDLNLASLTTTEGLKLPKHLSGSLYLNDLITIEGLELPEYIGEHLILASLTNAKGLKLPKHLGGSLLLSSLTTAEGLKLPRHISGMLFLEKLNKADGLKLPEYIGSNLNLSSLTTAKGLELPEYIGSDLNLSSLITAEGLKFPEYIRFNLYLSSLTSFEGAILPRTSEGRENLLNAVKKHNSLKLVISLKQEYKKHPIEEHSNNINEKEQTQKKETFKITKEQYEKRNGLRKLLDKIRGKQINQVQGVRR